MADLQRSSALYFECLEALASEQLEVRLSAVFMLGILAKEDHRMTDAVGFTLQAFLRRS
jgi:hypothetical protein